MNLYDEKGFPLPNEAYLRATDEEMQWWRDAKYGMFVHWGPAALCGGDISWCRRGKERPADYQTVLPPDVPAEIYDKLYQQFDPVNFSADEWIDTVKQAGMKYFVVITKHHDGFCLFDSRFTQHKSTAADCPAGRDFIKELADACHKKGVKFGIYYSGRDWYHPDYLADDNRAYLAYYTAQLTELLTSYGRIDLLWFDHIGGAFEYWNPDTILRLARSLHPGIIINDRLHALVKYGHMEAYDGDFSSPEQRLGQFDNKRAWESCLCLVGGVWSYKPGGEMMTFEQIVHSLVCCAGGDGNLLLNNGPMPDGRIEPRQRERLLEVGAWLQKYGDTIYSTRGGPILPTEEYACTFRDNKLFLHFLKPCSVTLPPIDGEILSLTVRSGDISCKLDGGVLTATISDSGEPDSILEITLNK